MNAGMLRRGRAASASKGGERSVGYIRIYITSAGAEGEVLHYIGHAPVACRHTHRVGGGEGDSP
jgi:hypothetical protein